MMRFLYLSLIITLLSSQTYSQEKWVLKYDADWTQIMTDSNDYHFFREFQSINNYTSSFIGFSADSIKAETGFMRYNLLHGHYVSFFKNGNIQFEGDYKDGKPVDKWKENYENGRLKSEYYIVGESETDYLRKYISFWDSLGTQLIAKGKGQVIFNQDSLVHKYTYKDGYLDGEAKIYNASNSLLFIEKYTRGKFVSGLNNNNKSSYTSIYTYPEYKTGNKEFNKLVYDYMKKEFKNRGGVVMSSNAGIDYMQASGAKPNEIDPRMQGVLKTSIIVSKEGKITSTELVDAKTTLIARLLLEAINKYSNDWKSATLRGQSIEDTLVYTFYFDLRSSGQKLLEIFAPSENPLKLFSPTSLLPYLPR